MMNQNPNDLSDLESALAKLQGLTVLDGAVHLPPMNLGPQTFEAKAKNIEGVLDVFDSLQEDIPKLGESVDEDDAYLDLEVACRLTLESEVRVIVTPDHVIVGGLIQDQNPINPMEDYDGQGAIVRKDEDLKKFNAALGLDSDGEPLIEGSVIAPFIIDDVWEELTSSNMDLMFDLIALARDYDKHQPLKELIYQAIEGEEGGEWNYGLARAITGTLFHQLDHDDQVILDEMSDIICKHQRLAWEQAFADGCIGTRYAVKIHVRRDWIETHEVIDALPWEDVDCDAVWVPCQEALKNMEFTASQTGDDMHDIARRYCEDVLTTYNQYLEGEVYGIAVYVIDRHTGNRIESHDDESWGYFGLDYATEELEGMMLAQAKSLTQKNMAH